MTTVAQALVAFELHGNQPAIAEQRRVLLAVVWIALLIYPRLSAGLTFALAVVVQLLCVLFLLVHPGDPPAGGYFLFAALAGGEIFGPAYAYLRPAVQALLAAVVSGVAIAGIFLGLRRLFLKDGGNSRQAEEP